MGAAFWDFLRGGGYLGVGIGGEGEAEVVLEFGSFGGGFEGSEEKRLKPGSDATMAMEVQNPTSQILFFYLFM